MSADCVLINVGNLPRASNNKVAIKCSDYLSLDYKDKTFFVFFSEKVEVKVYVLVDFKSFRPSLDVGINHVRGPILE